MCFNSFKITQHLFYAITNHLKQEGAKKEQFLRSISA
jgi:hypothetical protein